MRILSLPFLVLVLCLLTMPLFGQNAPVLFYSDLDSGPNVGGEGGSDGTFVCVYGENFGTAPGSFTVGGIEVAVDKLWADPGQPYVPGHYAKACGQINHLTADGAQTIQLTTASGASNPLPFTVRPGKIYWVETTGSDSSGQGTEGSPWATITKCNSQLAAGDICLIGPGVKLTTTGNFHIALQLSSSGKAGLPKTIVAYPGAAVAVNVSSINGGRALESYLDGANISYWTIAGITFDGGSFTVEFNRGSHIRFIDNDVMCSGAGCIYGNGNGGGFTTTGYPGNPAPGDGDVAYLWVYGNRFHSIGSQAAGKKYHNVYFSSSTNHVWFGWNTVDGSQGGACRGVQFNNTTANGNAGIGQWDLHVFNNAIHNTKCDGINFATVDPSKGATNPLTGLPDPSHYGVEAYNNVIYNAGDGLSYPYNTSGEAHYSCIYSPGAASAGSGSIRIYNNTLYNCGNNPGAFYSGDKVAVAADGSAVRMVLTNNIIVQTTAIPYFAATSKGALSGSYNDCYGNGSCSSTFGATTLEVNPDFVNARANDFHLQSGSPVIGVSPATPAPVTDGDGLLRFAPYTLGAYDFR
jgi:hypothetical protein